MHTNTQTHTQTRTHIHILFSVECNNILIIPQEAMFHYDGLMKKNEKKIRKAKDIKSSTDKKCFTSL